MKILVIDDSQLHRTAAHQQLATAHDLTVVGTYDEAHKLLEERYANNKAVKAELERRGFTKNPYDKSMTEEEKKVYWEENQRIEIELCPPPSFDIVLCDLLMPASRMKMGDKGMQYVGQEMPVGFALSLKAAIHGVRYIAVVTDTDHHDHPASAMIDAIGSRCPNERGANGVPPRFVLNGAKVGYYHSPMTLVEGTTCPDCNGTGDKEECSCATWNAGSPKSDCDSCKGTGHRCWTCRNSGKQMGKDWARVLAHLLEG